MARLAPELGKLWRRDRQQGLNGEVPEDVCLYVLAVHTKRGEGELAHPIVKATKRTDRAHSIQVAENWAQAQGALHWLRSMLKGY